MKKYQFTFLKTLLAIASLWTTTPKAMATDKESTQAKADLTVFANIEQVDDGNTFGDLTLKPRVSLEKGDYKAEYLGSFYNWGYSDHTTGDWLTLMSRIRLENSEWAAHIGRMQLRPDFVSYLKTPMTTTLDNDIMLAGTCRTFTGAHLTHKDSGLGLGIVAHDTRMSFNHWDTGLISWEKTFGSELGVAAHIGIGDKGLHNAGITTAWMPTDKTSVVLEGIYDQRTTHGILGAHHKITDDFSVFAGIKVSKPNQGKICGWAATGISYRLGNGFSVVGAIKHDIGGRNDIHGIIGLRYAGSFEIER